jgi:two-component system chemotaxis sensor kinase CheA
MSDYFDPNSEELLKDFFVEAIQQVETLERNILAVEDDPNDKDAVDEIFRAAHTLKGGAATVQMTELSNFTHLVEDLLDEMRSDKVKITTDVVDQLLNSIDVIKMMLQFRQEGSIYDENIDELKRHLAKLAGGKAISPEETNNKAAYQTKESIEEVGDVAQGLSEYEMLELQQTAGDTPVYKVKVDFDADNPMNSVGGIQIFARLKDMGQILKTQPDFDKLYEDTFYPTVIYFLMSEID